LAERLPSVSGEILVLGLREFIQPIGTYGRIALEYGRTEGVLRRFTEEFL
jgi:hypothetical protein